MPKFKENGLEFKPSTKEEEEYFKRLIDIESKIRKNDFAHLGKQMNKPVSTVHSSFYRVYSPLHFQVVEALEYFVNNRIKILSEQSKNLTESINN